MEEWAGLPLAHKVSLHKSGKDNAFWLVQPSTQDHGEWLTTGLQPPLAPLEGALG